MSKEKEQELLIKNYPARINQFRIKHVPEQYNQIKLLDELNNPDIDHYISISNRTDGKTFNYIHALLNIAIDYDLGLLFISRNWTLRPSYQTLIEEILEVSDVLERSDFNFIRAQHYVTLKYKGKSIALIADLNSASDLKMYSNFLKNFPIMVYDEFLALETDYLPDEWERLKTIYESIDRIEEYPLIHKPKLIYLGNAVNFESPVLQGLKIYNILEQHPINTAKIYKYDFNIMLEVNRNENANKRRNTRAFGSKDDAMTTARFEMNDHTIASDNDRNEVRKNPRFIYVKLKQDFLRIWFNPDSLTVILSIEARTEEEYHYNLQLKDNKEDSIYLKDTYFKDEHIRRINRGAYLFDNNFSKNYITTDFNGLNRLRINKLIREQLLYDTPELEMESKEKQFEENYMQQTKEALMRKMWG